jgi:adenylate cyclase
VGIEIERKFLVRSDQWRAEARPGQRYRQGYLHARPDVSVRVRVVGGEGFLTVKGATRGIERLEFEYVIPRADAETMLAQLCGRPLIEKTRFLVPHAGRTWEVDVFDGENAGLVVAEVELPSTDAELTLPPWVGQEVSGDARYYNANLARRPYAGWKDDR